MEEINLNNQNTKQLLGKVYQKALKISRIYEFVCNKTCSELLKSELSKSKLVIDEIKNNCETVAKTLNFEVQQLNLLQKTKYIAKLNINTFLDDATENLARMLIVELNKCELMLICDIDDSASALKEVVALANKLKNFLEKQQSDLKKFLVKDPAKYKSAVSESAKKKKKSSKTTSAAKKKKISE